MSARAFSFGAFVVEAGFIGDALAFALGDGSVRLVEGDDARTIAVHRGAILSATVSRDGKRLVTGGDDGLVARIGVDGKVETVAEVPKKWIDHVAAGPDNAVAYAAGRQVHVRLGDGRAKSIDLPRAAGGLAFAPKGMRVAAATYDGATLWWAGTDAAPTQLLWKGAHLAATFSPDGRFLITAMQENALHGWRLEDAKDMRMSGYPAKTRSMGWTVKGRYLATSGANAAILWPFQSKEGPMGKEPLQLGPREPLVTRVACHPREERLAIGYQDGAVILSGIADGEEITLREPGGGPVSALAFDGKGRNVVFGAEDGMAGVVPV